MHAVGDVLTFQSSRALQRSIIGQNARSNAEVAGVWLAHYGDY